MNLQVWLSFFLGSLPERYIRHIQKILKMFHSVPAQDYCFFFLFKVFIFLLSISLPVPV